MNDHRPTRWPCSADSSRNAGWPGSSARSFRKADTGASVSAMKVWRRGITACSRASARAASRAGATGRVSATTANEDLFGARERAAARVEEDGEVEEQV